jgi:hypothetical protein
MPLTAFQQEILGVLGEGRRDDRYLAGGAALHFAPQTARYSDDLDFFADAEDRVAAAFAADRARLEAAGCVVDVELSQPGLVRATVRRGSHATRVDWAHDSAWRFMPLERANDGTLRLHDMDLAINKVLALAGRDEPRDFVDILHVHRHVLPLGALVWAAVGKDPGFTPLSLLELLKRRGRPRPEDIARLQLAQPFDLISAKSEWLAALDEAERFVRSRPADEAGCLYYSPDERRFVMPDPGSPRRVVPHFGRPGGVLPHVNPNAPSA